MTENEMPTAGMLRVIGSRNATDIYCLNGLEEMRKLDNALSSWVETGQAGVYRLTGVTDKGHAVPVTIVLDDVVMLILLPPPSQLAIVPPGARIVSSKVQS